MPIIDSIQNRPNFLPLAIPKMYADELKKFHGNPFVWFGGQMLTYLMRFNENFKSKVREAQQKMNFNNHEFCVG